jgi:hypothetical protein
MPLKTYEWRICMSSKKCSQCGLVNFATAVTCKRCSNDLASAADSTVSRQPPAEYIIDEGSVRLKSDNPILSALITLVLVIFNLLMSYTHSQREHISSAGALGRMIGSVVAWPILLLIIYGISRKFRERYALHTVINYGLAVNAIVNYFM